jgi:hypothetical protein
LSTAVGARVSPLLNSRAFFSFFWKKEKKALLFSSIPFNKGCPLDDDCDYFYYYYYKFIIIIIIIIPAKRSTESKRE